MKKADALDRLCPYFGGDKCVADRCMAWQPLDPIDTIQTPTETTVLLARGKAHELTVVPGGRWNSEPQEGGMVLWRLYELAEAGYCKALANPPR